jgi:WD40 repeat protein
MNLALEESFMTPRSRSRIIAAALLLSLVASLAPALARAQTDPHFSLERSIALPGRGLAIAWSPDGDRIAAGGHFRGSSVLPQPPKTNFRYDTKVYDADSGALLKNFECHGFWVVAIAWADVPELGIDLIADGAGDHAVKIWNADGPGSSSCTIGQYLVKDGAIPAIAERQVPNGRGGFTLRKFPGLTKINGWILSLAFSPDRRFLAGASKDGSLRLWQVAPGRNQWKVVRLWNPRLGDQVTSVSWRPDGRALVTSDRLGRIAVWGFDPRPMPDGDLWDDAIIDDFADESETAYWNWNYRHPTRVRRTPVWQHDATQTLKSGTIRVVKVPSWNARYSPDGRQVAAVRTDGTFTVFDERDGTIVHRITVTNARGKAVALHGLDWSPDGELIAVGASDKLIRIYDASSGTLIDTLAGHNDLVTALAWSPDGRRLASTAGGVRVSLEGNFDVAGPDTSAIVWNRR